MPKTINQKREEGKAYFQQWRIKNPDYHDTYFKSPPGVKANRINTWKQAGIIHPDFNSVYETYINTTNCENCDIELTDGRGADSRCLDHIHHDVPTGSTNIRNVLCHRCNLLRG